MDGWTKVAILPRGHKKFSLVTIVCKDAKFIFMCKHQSVSIGMLIRKPLMTSHLIWEKRKEWNKMKNNTFKIFLLISFLEV